MAVVINTIAVFILLICLVECKTTQNKYAKKRTSSAKDTGEPLFLTPYFKTGEIEKARLLSKTGNLPNAPSIPSYSGFFTVNLPLNSNMFFWFFPAMSGDKKAPVILWLQGGPGASGLLGLFVEIGPYALLSNTSAKIRDYHWAKDFQIIFVDSPVGTGYSFTDNPKGYATNQADVASDLVEFLQQFFTMYYEYKDNDFYIAGESFAGKYIPALAFMIHSMGPSAQINLKGVAIGNGMCDPEAMLDYGDYLYSIGLVDEMQANEMKNLSSIIKDQIHNKDFFGALIEMEKLMTNFGMFPYSSLFKNFTGLNFHYNLLYSESPKEFTYCKHYTDLPEFRKAVHVGNLTMHDGKTVKKYLLLDIMRSVKEEVTVVMNNYRVLFYNGQLDVITPYPLTLNFLKSVDWKYAEEYKKTKRKIWRLKDGNYIAGYVHNVGDFYEVLVRNTGHIIPYDIPEVALDMIYRFITGFPPFSS